MNKISTETLNEGWDDVSPDGGSQIIEFGKISTESI